MKWEQAGCSARVVTASRSARVVTAGCSARVVTVGCSARVVTAGSECSTSLQVETSGLRRLWTGKE